MLTESGRPPREREEANQNNWTTQEAYQDTFSETIMWLLQVSVSTMVGTISRLKILP